MNRLKNRVAIITGAASGIGLACTRLFIHEGAQVVAVDQPSADTTQLQAVSDQESLLILQQDITEESASSHIVSSAIGRFNQLDVLVNNAGVLLFSMAEDLDFNLWDRSHEVNVRAGMTLIHTAIPHLKQSSAGRIVNISSVQSTRALPGLAAYCSSKAAINGMTRVLALELGKFGITANYIEPGATNTAMTADALAEPGVTEEWENKSPLKRIGQPEDIARGALFLASDDASYITGQGLRIDGGAMLSV